MNLNLEPQKTARVLGLIAAVLVLHHIAIKMAGFFLFPETESPAFRFYSYLFTVNAEGVVPTAFSMLCLMFCAALLLLIGVKTRVDGGRFVAQWIVLALIFSFLSLDEGFEIHERLTDNARDAFSTSGLLYNAWVIPYTMFLAVFVSAYARFTFCLPRRTRAVFMTAGTLYVFGAVGMELFGGRHADAFGTQTPTYAALTTIEEVFELAGIVTFVFGLLAHLATEMRTLPSVTFSFAGEPRLCGTSPKEDRSVQPASLQTP